MLVYLVGCGTLPAISASLEGHQFGIRASKPWTSEGAIACVRMAVARMARRKRLMSKRLPGQNRTFAFSWPRHGPCGDGFAC